MSSRNPILEWVLAPLVMPALLTVTAMVARATHRATGLDLEQPVAALLLLLGFFANYGAALYLARPRDADSALPHALTIATNALYCGFIAGLYLLLATYLSEGASIGNDETYNFWLIGMFFVALVYGVLVVLAATLTLPLTWFAGAERLYHLFRIRR